LESKLDRAGYKFGLRNWLLLLHLCRRDAWGVPTRRAHLNSFLGQHGGCERSQRLLVAGRLLVNPSTPRGRSFVGEPVGPNTGCAGTQVKRELPGMDDSFPRFCSAIWAGA